MRFSSRFSTVLFAVKKSKERIRLLSCFSKSSNSREIDELCFKCASNSPIIGPMYKRIADEHADRYGPGREHTETVKNIRNRFEDDDEELNFSNLFILSNTENYNFGVRALQKDDETTVKVPLATATKSAEEMLILYKAPIDRDNETEEDDDKKKKAIKGSQFKTLMCISCREKYKCLAALDSVYVK